MKLLTKKRFYDNLTMNNSKNYIIGKNSKLDEKQKTFSNYLYNDSTLQKYTIPDTNLKKE